MRYRYGKWRCVLCGDRRWRHGTYADWSYHWLTFHQKDTDGD